MKRDEITIDDIIYAGATYRALKTFITYSSTVITNRLNLTKKEAEPFYTAINKVFKLENRIGFERVAFDVVNSPCCDEELKQMINDFPGRLFYGEIRFDDIMKHCDINDDAEWSRLETLMIDEAKKIIKDCFKLEMED